jgi:hypothetical protein
VSYRKSSFSPFDFHLFILIPADEERTFLISEELEFRTSSTDDEPSFIWRDLNGDIDESFEFVATGTNEPTKAFFETCMYRAMFERKYKRGADQTKDSDLDEFIWQCVSLPYRAFNEPKFLPFIQVLPQQSQNRPQNAKHLDQKLL